MYEDEWCVATTRSGKGKYQRPTDAGGSYCSPKILDRKRGYRKTRNVYDCVQDQGGEEYEVEEKMSGRGTLIWGNGDQYDGIWENGAPKGSGVFTWTDGSYYITDWCKDVIHHSQQQQQLDGLYYSGIGVPRGLGSGVEFVGEGLGKRLYGFSSVKGFPRICVWESDGDDGDITCEIVDNTELPESYLDAVKTSGVGNELVYFSPSCFSDGAKKPGETIRKGHRNYDLMLSLQLGVRYIFFSVQYNVYVAL